MADRRTKATVRSVLSSLIEEFVLLLALSLIVVGLWPLVGMTSLVVPGVVLLWVALPQRKALVERPVDSRRRES